ncbi:hypothetical protein BDA99DRAFT_583403 [Phascolomyces articulosus]|uniref:Uncharacterized protein n=1 Tax=Phascolomyces articulosus TaxID=60185 RepID=A0AAD5KAN9_9FUNG|nr:hypothetical protein BDA99DRAFT_583403 [Phascolomyces articulosus]
MTDNHPGNIPKLFIEHEVEVQALIIKYFHSTNVYHWSTAALMFYISEKYQFTGMVADRLHFLKIYRKELRNELKKRVQMMDPNNQTGEDTEDVIKARADRRRHQIRTMLKNSKVNVFSASVEKILLQNIYNAEMDLQLVKTKLSLLRSMDKRHLSDDE